MEGLAQKAWDQDIYTAALLPYWPPFHLPDQSGDLKPIEATTTNIYNDYIVNLARHAKGWRVCRGLNVPITL